MHQSNGPCLMKTICNFSRQTFLQINRFTTQLFKTQLFKTQLFKTQLFKTQLFGTQKLTSFNELHAIICTPNRRIKHQASIVTSLLPWLSSYTRYLWLLSCHGYCLLLSLWIGHAQAFCYPRENEIHPDLIEIPHLCQYVAINPLIPSC